MTHHVISRCPTCSIIGLLGDTTYQQCQEPNRFLGIQAAINGGSSTMHGDVIHIWRLKRAKTIRNVTDHTQITNKQLEMGGTDTQCTWMDMDHPQLGQWPWANSIGNRWLVTSCYPSSRKKAYRQESAMQLFIMIVIQLFNSLTMLDNAWQCLTYLSAPA